MNSTTHHGDQPLKDLTTTSQPQYKCSHGNKIPEKSKQISPFQSNFIHDYPHVLMTDQNIRKSTDVYRREKHFLEQQNQPIVNKQIFTSTEDNLEKPVEPEYYMKEHFYNIPCNCETSLPGRLFQNFISGIKMSLEFVLFMGYTITRRNELLECHYSFDRTQLSNCQVNHNYPFVRRPTYNNEMKKLNTIRRQLNRKSSPIKHTMTNTYYDIH